MQVQKLFYGQGQKQVLTPPLSLNFALVSLHQNNCSIDNNNGNNNND